MTQAPVPSPPPWIDAEAANEELVKLSELMSEYFWDTMEATYPDANIPTMKAEVGKNALRTFLNRTETADMPVLIESDDSPQGVMDKYRAGVYLPFASVYWMALSASPRHFVDELTQFRRLWRQHMES